MPRRGSSKATRAPRDARTLVEVLDGAEAKELLGRLLDAHPELLVEAASHAEAQLGAVTASGVAEEVVSALEDLSVEDIWERAGSHADGSYVESTEAAWEVVEEAVASFLADLTRRVELGRWPEATAICQGVLLGLHRVSDGEGEFLEGHAPDSLEETAAHALGTWKKGAGRRAGSRKPAGEIAAMRSFVSSDLPEWRSFLSRALGRAPARSRGRHKRR